MYSDASKGGLVGREGLQAFILDTIAASPPPSAPPDYRRTGPAVVAEETVTPAEEEEEEEEVVVVEGQVARSAESTTTEPDFEVVLRDVLGKMASVVLSEVSKLYGEDVLFRLG